MWLGDKSFNFYSKVQEKCTNGIFAILGKVYTDLRLVFTLALTRLHQIIIGYTMQGQMPYLIRWQRQRHMPLRMPNM